MPGIKRLRADGARNREAIIAAARAAFDRNEFDRRFDDFASLAGVGVGTLYRHFPTRDALAEAVYEEEVAGLCRHAEQLLAELPPAEALASFLREFVARLAAQTGLARTLATLLRDRSKVQDQGGLALEDAVSHLVAAAVRDGGLADDVTPGAVMTALHGIGSAHGLPHWQEDAENLITVLVRPNPRRPHG